MQFKRSFGETLVRLTKPETVRWRKVLDDMEFLAHLPDFKAAGAAGAAADDIRSLLRCCDPYNDKPEIPTGPPPAPVCDNVPTVQAEAF